MMAVSVSTDLSVTVADNIVEVKLTERQTLMKSIEKNECKALGVSVQRTKQDPNRQNNKCMCVCGDRNSKGSKGCRMRRLRTNFIPHTTFPMHNLMPQPHPRPISQL